MLITLILSITHIPFLFYLFRNEVDDLLSGQPSWAVSGLEPTGTIEWFDANGNLIDKGAGEYNKHGNDSWAYDQRGFDYIMRDQFGYNLCH